MRRRGRRTVTVNATAGSTGTATNVILALDLSSSTASQVSRRLKRRRPRHAECARRRRRRDRQLDRRQPRRRHLLPGHHGHDAGRARVRPTERPRAAVNGLPASSTGESARRRHRPSADSLLAAGRAGFTKSLVLITDGQANSSELIGRQQRRDDGARRPASASSRSGWATPDSTANLRRWASQSSYYQNARARSTRPS